VTGPTLADLENDPAAHAQIGVARLAIESQNAATGWTPETKSNLVHLETSLTCPSTTPGLVCTRGGLLHSGHNVKYNQQLYSYLESCEGI
jgi:hypothetical protein